MPGYCTLSIGKNKMKSSRDFTLSYNHNYRVDDVPNVDESLTSQNEELIKLPEGQTYLQAYRARMEDTEQYRDFPPRKDAVRGFEVILSYSRSERDRIDIEKWKADNVTWLKKTFNKDPEKYGENVISAVYHADEAGNPHIHAMVIPIDEKGHLNYSAYVDGPQSLRHLHDEYAKFMKEEHDLERGTRYSTAKHEDVKRFYSNVNQAVAMEGPAIIPGESVEQYKQRSDQFIKDNALATVSYERQVQQKADRRIGTYREKAHDAQSEIKSGKDIIKKRDLEIKDLNEDIKAYQTQVAHLKAERDAFVREYGDIPSAKKKLDAMDALQNAFQTYPDEEIREATRNQMNDFIRWGMIQKQKEIGRGSRDKDIEHE